MPKKVLDVGNCQPDHEAISNFLSKHFDCQVTQAHGLDDMRTALDGGDDDGDYVLVLVNRKLDRDYSDGIEIIRQIRADPKLTEVTVMLITNYAEHQDAAIALGAKRGFGKLEFEKSETLERLRQVLE